MTVKLKLVMLAAVVGGFGALYLIDELAISVRFSTSATSA